MALVIGFESSSKRYRRYLESGQSDKNPKDVAFRLPQGTKKGDRVLYFVGADLQYFVGFGTIVSNQKIGRSGLWEGMPYWLTSPEKMLSRPVPGADVEAATGFAIPKRQLVVEQRLESAVWKSARGKPLIQTERAMEGATTEARSRYRDPGLRQSAIQLAKGFCAACDVDFARTPGGLGRHCLVVHHKKQLRDTDQIRETKLSDLAVVCANCHMMIHSDPAKALTVAQLRRKLRT